MRKQKQRNLKTGSNLSKNNTLTLQEALRMFGPVIAVVVAFIGTIIHFKSNQLSAASQDGQQTGGCILSKPYIYNYTSGFLRRDFNMQKYSFPYSGSSIDRRSCLSIQEFWDVYDAKWPVLITDVVPKWNAFSWTSKYFSDHYGDERVVMKACRGMLRDATSLALPLKLFLKHLNDSSPTSWTYFEDELFLPLRKELRSQIPANDYNSENWFNLFPPELRPWDCMILWGTAYSRSSLHIDPYNWTGTNAVLKGKKRWRLFPPGQDSLLSVYPDRKCGFPLECMKYNSPIDAFSLETNEVTFPLFKRAFYLEFEQQPGELLIIPTGWFHQAYNVETTLAISGQIMNRNNHLIILEEILKAGVIKRSAIPSYFNELEPKEQVKLFVSLLPKKVIEKGKMVTEEVINQVKQTSK
ncbi:F-box protein At1g78280-like [Gigantopelta aegis]|uniref:F-box protein At1g78280-like n=1 Tax=Gigantopelta aegis TaxID=1735272 RepID=UPI001B888AF7|nr:F-box protein At1g78280-like [Gigantopelta aegis]